MHHIENVDYIIILIVVMIGLLVLLLGENVQHAGAAFFSQCDSTDTKSTIEGNAITVTYNKCTPRCLTVKQIDTNGKQSEETFCGSSLS